MKMMYEQQQLQNDHMMMKMDLKNKKGDGNESIEEEEDKLEVVVDLSNMCLDSLPNPSINLATICKLDLSNNNLQVCLSFFQWRLDIVFTVISLFRRKIFYEKFSIS